MTEFYELDEVMASSLQKVFAEPTLLHPRMSTQYTERSADPDRMEAIIHGIFSAGPAQDDLRGDARDRPFAGTTLLVSQTASLWVARAELAALTQLPSPGDAITLINRAQSPAYAISAVQTTDMGDLNLILTAEDPSP